MSPTPADSVPDSERLEQLERAIGVLQLFTSEHPLLTVSEVAQLSDTSRATARRILLTYRALGILNSDGRSFFLTPKVLSLGWNYFASMGIEDIVRPIIADLVAEIDESCSMSTLDLPDIVYLARVQTRRVMTISGGIGSRLPAHATASGRVLLAALPDEEVDAFLSAAPLERFTDRTIVDPDALRADLEVVRERGWALTDQELEVGLRGLSVPVTGRDGRVIAALNVSTSSARTSLDEVRSRCLPPLLVSAGVISTAMAQGGGRNSL